MSDYRQMNRRTVIAAAGIGLLLSQESAKALSPMPPPLPTLEDYVKRADLIVVGTIERFVFRGANFGVAPNEYEKDYEEDDGKGTRAMDMFVNANRILKNKSEYRKPYLVRMQNRASYMKSGIKIGVRRVFLLDQGSGMQINGLSVRVFQNLTEPRSLKDEFIVRQLIAQSRGTHGK